MSPAPERILLVESDPDISQVIARQALRPLGYDVTVLTNAADGIEAALADPPDLIIANLNLPDLGGKDVLAAISAKGVNAPLVVIAEKGDERRAIQAFRLGAADAILWPARDAEVVRVVERSLQPTRTRRVRRQLYQQMETAQEELGRRHRAVDSILAVAHQLAPGADPRTLLQRLATLAVEMGEAELAWFTVRDEKTHSFVLRAQVNLPAGWTRKLDRPFDDGLSSLVVNSGRPLSLHGTALEKFKVANLGKSAAVLPAKVRNEVLAVLIVMRKADLEINGQTQKVLQGIADLAATGLLQSRLLKAVQDSSAATRRESRNWARLQQTVESALEHLGRIQAGEAGEFDKAQKEALSALRVSLQQIGRTAARDE